MTNQHVLYEPALGAHSAAARLGSRLFVILPCFNEEQSLGELLRDLDSEFASIRPRFELTAAEIVCVDDGSDDDTWRAIQAASGAVESPVHAVRLSRNFGHQAALCAGLDYVMDELHCSDSDTVILMDADGQHPPRLLPELLEARAKSFHHVQMIRSNDDARSFKGASSRFYYWLFRALSGLDLAAGSSDFRAFSGRFLQAYAQFSESTRFNRGLFHWLGFPTVKIPYEASPRKLGSSKYSLGRMVRFGLNGVTYFSSRPLVYTLAAITCFGFFACSLYLVIEAMRIIGGASFVPGWATVIFAVMFWGSLLSFSQLLIAIYLARVFDEVKKRPGYVVLEKKRAGTAAGSADVVSAQGML